MRYQLGIDIGGTFTDLSLFDNQTGQLLGLKTPTIPENPAEGVRNGLQLLAERGVAADEIGYFVHGTTIGVNTIIQRRGARIALLVTEGFRDVLEMARLRLPSPWDFYAQRPTPLLPRELVLPVRERMRHTGAVETPLTEAEIARAVAEVAALEVEGVAICLLHAYANAAHEHALQDALRERLPHLFISCSSDVWPQMREYERALVTVMNAYVRPPLERYLTDLEQSLQASGLPARPYLTRSNGGIMTTTAAKEHPVQTLLSGPASGVTGALGVATRAGFGDVITFDMGGTSADVALISDGAPEFSREAQVGDFPLFLPVVGVVSIGAGGGSIAWLDGAGVLKVGPRSAGADPGPACYGLGGTEPALSDAFLLCGLLDPERFAGKVRLDQAAAEAAIAPLAELLGLGLVETADAIVRVALATMYTELSGVLERRGVDPRNFTLVAFGGAGPVVACRLAAEMKFPRVLIPSAPGTLCAWGALQADVAADFIRSVHWNLATPVGGTRGGNGETDVAAAINPHPNPSPCAQGEGLSAASRGQQPSYLPLSAPVGERVQAAMDTLEEQARDWLRHEAPAVEETALHWTADMRYVGQAYEIETEVEPDALRSGSGAALAAAFHVAHERLFNHADLEAPVEMVNLRVRAIGELPQRLEGEPDLACTEPAAPTGTRAVLIDGKPYEVAIYQRETLGREQEVAGPAIVEQPDTTTVIPAGWRATVDRVGNLVVGVTGDG